MKDKINKYRILFQNNKKIVENYFFMTVLQVLNSLFYFFIYPFLIRTLGPDSYGLYVFAMSIVTYFSALVNFGFDMPAVKSIAQNSDKNEVKSDTLSCVFTSKLYLELVSVFIFIALIILLPALRTNWIVFSICFFNSFTSILFPQWYFQGMQRMRIVTMIQFSIKLISLPFIFLTIKEAKDLWIFATIATSTNVISALIAFYIIVYKDKLKISLVCFDKIKSWYVDSLPFFWSNSANIIKQQSTTIIVAAFFGMRDVALYDLAMKIFQLPVIILSSINSALFPKLVQNINPNKIKKIIRNETFLGILVILFLVAFGRLIISILGGSIMINTYPLLVALSFSIFTILTVGAIFSFIFVPKGKYKYIAYNQTFAFVGFFLFLSLGLLTCKNIIIVPLAITFSSIVEILYCYYLLKTKP